FGAPDRPSGIGDIVHVERGAPGSPPLTKGTAGALGSGELARALQLRRCLGGASMPVLHPDAREPAAAQSTHDDRPGDGSPFLQTSLAFAGDVAKLALHAISTGLRRRDAPHPNAGLDRLGIGHVVPAE